MFCKLLHVVSTINCDASEILFILVVFVFFDTLGFLYCLRSIFLLIAIYIILIFMYLIST